MEMPVEKLKRNGRASQLAPEQHTAIQLLLEGNTIADVAAEVGVSEQTINAWKKKRIFAREYVRAARMVTEAGLNMLKVHLIDAIERLVEISTQKDANRVQLEANKHIIKLVMEDEVLRQINERLEKLEAGANREP